MLWKAVQERVPGLLATVEQMLRDLENGEVKCGHSRCRSHAIEAMVEVRDGSVGEGEHAAGGGVGADWNPVQQVGGGFDDLTVPAASMKRQILNLIPEVIGHAGFREQFQLLDELANR